MKMLIFKLIGWSSQKLSYRKKQEEFRSFIQLGIHGDMGVMQAQDLVGEGQADTITGIAKCIGPPVKWLEYILDIIFTDPDTFITNADHRHIILKE